ncbi:hypothetical protein ONA91_27215 [Micromonospora sp. DR5-3]|uniref:hypothetical protein n=1 Tax=unclassified Micromonospora TaxID=2617518 RepID=UPI0011D5DDBB|nr:MULTISPECIES: hypothetical protein [unclassified Micromonospora]MCW3818145.1 hypothetical protein [Micromonospora sp. DR5-3]TYC21343.1 hypothetical protein FXF52_26240 [Micromonospora sp. MP36]
MQPVWTSVIAVLGTLAGAIVSHGLAQRGADRRHAQARTEQLRQEQLVACRDVAAAATELRRSGNDLWHRREERRKDKTIAAADDFYAHRTALWRTYYHLRLLLDDVRLTAAAGEIIEGTSAIPDADSHEELRRHRDAVSALIEDFVAAGRYLRSVG